MHTYVPWASAVDANVRQREQIGHHILGSGHMIWLIVGARRPHLKNRAQSAISLIAMLIAVGGKRKKVGSKKAKVESTGETKTPNGSELRATHPMKNKLHLIIR
jgi:hypothetical protein